MLRTVRMVGISAVLWIGASAAESLPLQAELRPPDVMNGDAFGESVVVSADGRTLLISAPRADCSAGSNCGAVYVFSRRFGEWRQEARITAPDAAAHDDFGSEMAVSAAGDVAFVGAETKGCPQGPFCGAAYVFTRAAEGVWTLQQKLVSSDLAASGRFGAGLALTPDGANAWIGAFGVTCGGGQLSCGAVYEFARHGGSWSQVGKLNPPHPRNTGGFGAEVAVSANGLTLMVAHAQFDAFGGTVEVFQRQGGAWVPEATIVAPDDFCSNFFGLGGIELSDDGNTVLLPLRTALFCNADFPGRVFVFTRQGGTWLQQAELIPAQGLPSNGVALSADGNQALLGVEQMVCQDGGGKVAFHFSRHGDTWSEDSDLRVPNPVPATFSASVDLSAAGGVAAVGGSTEECQGFLPPAPPPESTRVLVFGQDFLPEVPALSGRGLVALALAFAAGGAALLRRRRLVHEP